MFTFTKRAFVAFSKSVWQFLTVHHNRASLLASLASLTLFASLLSACSSTPHHAPRARPSVLLISIDGLRSDFYRPDSGWEAPTLQALAAQGASAESAEPIFPSLTYPSHSTIVTGVRSSKHGVFSNMVFSIKDGETPLWYWNADYLQAPTIWQRAKAAGYKTAILTWPGTVGAPVDWIIPEIFPAPPLVLGTTWELMLKSMSPALAQELVDANSGRIPDGFEPRDEWVATSAEHLLKQGKADFTLMHLINVDHAMHEHGMNSPEAHQALTRADSQLARILAAVDLKQTTVFVVGDHGFYDYDKVVRPNTLLAQQGWLREKQSTSGELEIQNDWKVITHAEGGAATVYVRDKRLERPVLRLLKKHAGPYYRVVERAELDRLEAFPSALCALNPTTSLDGGPGFAISDEARGPFFEKLSRVRGNHGPLPQDPRLMSGLIVAGPHLTAGKKLGKVRLLDIAPTIARLIDVPFSEAEGQPISLQ